MKKATKQRTPADLELTHYLTLEVIFRDKKGMHLFSIRLDRNMSDDQYADVYFDLHLGSKVPLQWLTIGSVDASALEDAKVKHVETITVDTSRGFNNFWYLTVKGEPRFRLQLDGEGSEQLAYFCVLDDEGEPITTLAIERDAAAKTALIERRNLAEIRERAEEIGTVQDRREWETERFIELIDHFGNKPEVRAFLMTYLEALAAPDDIEAQCKTLGYYLAAILANDATPASVHNAVGDHVNDLGYDDHPRIIGGVLWSYYNSKASEAEKETKGGEA